MLFDEVCLPELIRFVHISRRAGYRDRMRWEALFDDLEAQFDAVELSDRAATVSELTRAERATVRLDARLRAALGARLVVRVRGGDQHAGELLEAAAQWLLLAEGPRRILVPLHAVVAVGGLGASAEPDARTVLRKLGLGHALRALSRDRVFVRIDAGGVEVRGRIDVVGADHIDVAALGEDGRALSTFWTVPVAAIDVVASA